MTTWCRRVETTGWKVHKNNWKCQEHWDVASILWNHYNTKLISVSTHIPSPDLANCKKKTVFEILVFLEKKKKYFAWSDETSVGVVSVNKSNNIWNRSHHVVTGKVYNHDAIYAPLAKDFSCLNISTPCAIISISSWNKWNHWTIKVASASSYPTRGTGHLVRFRVVLSHDLPGGLCSSSDRVQWYGTWRDGFTKWVPVLY